MPDQSFYSGGQTGFTDHLCGTTPHVGLPKDSKVDVDFFEQLSGTNEGHASMTLSAAPNRSVDLQEPSKFPQSMTKVIWSFQSQDQASEAMLFRCSWPKCGLTDVFKGLKAIQEHVEKVHITTLQAACPGCKWPDCESKNGSFKTPKLLNDHLQNIHIEPLICVHPRCPHTKPFGKQGDLERHHKSKHAGGSMPHKCPHTSCPKPINGFARRDKLREHLRNWHGNFECLQQGCHRGPGNGFKTEGQLTSHTQTAHKTLRTGCPLPHCETSNTTEAARGVPLKVHFEAIHGDYDCELGICERARSSEFIPDTLKKHLINHHVIDPSEAVGLVDALVKAGESALKDSQLLRLGWAQGQRGLQSRHTGKTFMECISCLSSL
jgi:hypothetical protein